MCFTLDDVLYIELVTELSVNITVKHILVLPPGRVHDRSLFHDQLDGKWVLEPAWLWMLVAYQVISYLNLLSLRLRNMVSHIWISNNPDT